MRGILLTLVTVLATIGASGTDRFHYASWERVLAEHVDEQGYVNYAALKAKRQDLDTFIALISKISPASHPALFQTPESRLAYWINAYNAWILRVVVDHYPVQKITDIGWIPYSVFFFRYIRLGGKKMSFRNLENEIIRKGFGDPRIHFALNCASRGCPRLPREIFHPERINEQLDQVAREYHNDDRHVRLEPGTNRLVLAKIFDWYEEDFLSWGQNHLGRKVELQDYVQLYLTPERKQQLARFKKIQVVFRDYDWGLNDQAKKGGGS
jgi:hypothetical protein